MFIYNYYLYYQDPLPFWLKVQCLVAVGFLLRRTTRRHSWPGCVVPALNWEFEHAPCHPCLHSGRELQLAVTDEQFYKADEALEAAPGIPAMFVSRPTNNVPPGTR